VTSSRRSRPRPDRGGAAPGGSRPERSARSARARERRARLLDELRAFLILTAYLTAFFGSFTAYRRLVLAEVGISYLHYGAALVEGALIAKVLLIGRALNLNARFERGSLAASSLLLSAGSTLLVLLVGLLERLVEGLLRRESLEVALRGMAATNRDELLARLMVVFVALIPFFAFWQLARAIGPAQLRVLTGRRG
jgi:hypothetical protein